MFFCSFHYLFLFLYSLATTTSASLLSTYCFTTYYLLTTGRLFNAFCSFVFSVCVSESSVVVLSSGRVDYFVCSLGGLEGGTEGNERVLSRRICVRSCSRVCEV